MSELNNVTTQQLGKLTMYCGGGAGIGIGKYFESDRNKIFEGHASLCPYYMDTSTASTFGVPEEFFYHLGSETGEDTDGSGGIRSEHGETIGEHAKEILQKFPPADASILISSTTGGSGCNYIQALASELLAQGKLVFIFHVGGDDTLNYIKNTISTLAGYPNIAKLRGMPVILSYLQNGKDGTVEEIDEIIRGEISCLTVLFSRQNRNMDSRDLFHWANFSRRGVTTFDPQVAVLKIGRGAVPASDYSLISLATLSTSLNNTKADRPVEFQRVGIPSYQLSDKQMESYPLHFAIFDGFMDSVMKDMKKQRDDYSAKASSRVIRNTLTAEGGTVAKNGMVYDD